MPEYHTLRGQKSLQDDLKPDLDDPMVIEVDLKPYLIKVRDYFSLGSNGYRWAVPSDAKIGKQAAKDCDLVKRLPHAGKILIKVANGTHFEYPRESFWKGFLGPSARKLGPEHLGQLIVTTNKDLVWVLKGYLEEEQKRIDTRAAKKAKEKAIADPNNWTDPINFFVPEIGTHLRLTGDWTFKLYQERRNTGLIELLGLFDGTGWPDWRRGHQHKPNATLTIKEGAELTVDRIYIRKGVEEYSSLTFFLGKGAMVVDEAAPALPNRTTKKIRFWAKLKDCNKIQGVIAKASVPGLD